MTKLTDAKIQSLTPREAPYKVADGGGLLLCVTISGTKLWRYKFRFAGREKTLSLGVYPVTSLQAARFARDDAKRLLVAGVDPAVEKQNGKKAARLVSPNPNSPVAYRWRWIGDDNWNYCTVAPEYRADQRDIEPLYAAPQIKK